MKMTTIIVMIGLFVVSCSGRSKGVQQLTQVEAHTVARGIIEQKVLFTGNIVAESAFDVYPRAAGKVSAKLLKEGDPVKKNQPILLVDRDEVGYTYKQMPVVSLVDGFVGTISADVGTNVSPQTSVVTVVQPGKMRVKLDVPERYLRVILAGTEVSMTVDTLGDETFKGVIVTSSPYVSEKTRTANVEVAMPNEDGRLKHGMFGRMYLVVERHDDVLIVPINSISWEGEKRFVYKIVDGKLVRSEVKTGIRNDVHVEVLEGLNEGDTLVTGDLLGLKNGEAVTTK